MNGMSQDIGNLAMMTAVVGMGVVFTALFLLSIYMIIFKRIIGNLEKQHAAKKEAKVSASAAAPSLAPALAAADPEEERLAATIGLALHLEGVHQEVPADVAAVIGLALHLEGAQPNVTADVPADVAAAIMTALHMHIQGCNQAQIEAAMEPTGPAANPSWKMAGWMESHSMRLQAQLRKAG